MKWIPHQVRNDETQSSRGVKQSKEDGLSRCARSDEKIVVFGLDQETH